MSKDSPSRVFIMVKSWVQPVLQDRESTKRTMELGICYDSCQIRQLCIPYLCTDELVEKQAPR